MYVYGGMCDLVELADFWAFDFDSRRWTQVTLDPLKSFPCTEGLPKCPPSSFCKRVHVKAKEITQAERIS